jgi:hypothetical protein
MGILYTMARINGKQPYNNGGGKEQIPSKSLLNPENP